jgi:hypothetical protein
MDRGYLFRGTTIGWPGHDSLRELGITPTSADPLVATLFALHCLRYGKGIVQFCLRREVEHLIGEANSLAEIEVEVALNILPDLFTQHYVVHTVDSVIAASILRGLGYELPAVISRKRIFEIELEAAGRLSQDEIATFIKLAGVS